MKTVLFDFDGVIGNTFNLGYEVMRTDGFLRKEVTKEEFRFHFEQNIYDLELDEKSLNEILEKQRGYFGKYAPGLYEMDPYPGIVEVIKMLSQKYELILISSTIKDVLDKYLARTDLRKYFKDVYPANYDLDKKEQIEKIKNNSGASSGEMIYVTDTLRDIRIANDLGIKSIAIAWGYQTLEMLKKGDPLALIKTPEEIVDVVEKYLK